PFEPLRRQQHIGRQVALVLDAQVETVQVTARRSDLRIGDYDARRERRDAQERSRLATAHCVDALERRVPQPEARIHAADLDLAELRMLYLAPGREHAPGVVLGVPFCE